MSHTAERDVKVEVKQFRRGRGLGRDQQELGEGKRKHSGEGRICSKYKLYVYENANNETRYCV